MGQKTPRRRTRSARTARPLRKRVQAYISEPGDLVKPFHFILERVNARLPLSIPRERRTRVLWHAFYEHALQRAKASQPNSEEIEYLFHQRERMRVLMEKVKSGQFILMKDMITVFEHGKYYLQAEIQEIKT